MIRLARYLLVALLATACSTTETATSVVEAATTTSSTVTTQPVAETTTTTADLAPEALFETWGAALEIGEQGWEDAFVGPGALVWANGQYHLFYTGAGNEQVGSTVGYASTNRLEDGFFRRVETPLLTVDDADYLDYGPSPKSALVAADGTWILFFHTSGLGGRFSSGLIGRATAPAPEGPWTVDPTPAVTPGEDGAWDDLSVRDPFVVAVDDGYRMYYSGDTGDADARRDRQIGLATSVDGLTWVKHDEPVLRVGSEDAWDGLRVFEPVVMPTGDGYVMFYASTRHFDDERVRTYMYGYAVSADGVAWERPTEGPVFTSGDNYAIFGGRVLRDGETWYLVYGVQRQLGNPAQVELAIWRGPLPTD